MTRYLRFAAAGFFALLTIALIGLWVRSYYRWDALTGGRYLLTSYRGIARVMLFDDPWPLGDFALHNSVRADLMGPAPLGDYGILGFSLRRDAATTIVLVPYWFLAVSSLALAALFAFKRPWRFTIRALLIATTLIAAALGLGVYLLQ